MLVIVVMIVRDWHWIFVAQARSACKVKLRDKFEDGMHARNGGEGIKRRIGRHREKPLDGAAVFVQISLEDFGLPAICHWNCPILLRPSPTPQCHDTYRKGVFRPSGMPAATDKITVPLHFEQIHRGCVDLSASTAPYLKKVDIGGSNAESGKHTDRLIHQAYDR